jgi:hypothetical protein
MNNSFARLIDGMCATLRQEVLTRLDDGFARGQVFGVINVLNTFKVRADWSAGFLQQQVGAQQQALEAVDALIRCAALPAASAPPAPLEPLPPSASIDQLLAARDDRNRSIGAWLAWLDAERGRLPDALAGQVEAALRAAMRAEVDLELKNSPRPLFAQMSSGRED